MPAMSRLSPLTLLSTLLLAALLPSPTLSTCAISAWDVTNGPLNSTATSPSFASPNTYAFEFYNGPTEGTTQNNNTVPDSLPSLKYSNVAFPFFNVSSASYCAQCNTNNQWVSWVSETTTNFFNVIVNGQYYTSAGTWAALPPGVANNLYDLNWAYSQTSNRQVWANVAALGLGAIGNIGLPDVYTTGGQTVPPSGFSIRYNDVSNAANTTFKTNKSSTRACNTIGGPQCPVWSVKLPAGLWQCATGAFNYVFVADASYYYNCVQPAYFLTQNSCPTVVSSSTGGSQPINPQAPSPTSTPSARGDPQFAGLRGQDYQVHGIDGGVYNVISDAHMQLNSRFVFLTGPRPCPVMPSTGLPSVACFAHSGSYLGNLALLTASGEKVLIESGPALTGLTSVTYNGQEMEVGDTQALTFANGRTGSVTVISSHEVLLTAGLFNIEVESSDAFLNLRSVLVKAGDWQQLKDEKAHGLLGQTWQLRKGRSAIEGRVDDYLLESEDLFGVDFVFNRFALAK